MPTTKPKSLRSKRDIFPLSSRILSSPPTREDLYWTRSHLIRMDIEARTGTNPYVYIRTIPESTKLRCILADLNPHGLSLWPVRLTTNMRIAAARSALRTFRSTLNSILKEYPK